MDLKKSGDLVYASIKMFSAQELAQFKRFLKFEYTKPAPFLKITSIASKLTGDWNFGTSFPEAKLKEKCDEDILKNFVKYKYKLKQSLENFVNYLGSTDQSKSTAIHFFYKRAFFIHYHYFYKLGLYRIAYQEIENLAKETFEAGHFDFSDVLYRNLNYFTPFAFADPFEAIQESKRIGKILHEHQPILNYHTEINIYLQLFFNASKTSLQESDLLDEEILAFEKIEKQDSEPIIVLYHLLAEVFLSTATKNLQRDLDVNLEIVDFYKKNKDLPASIKRHNFSVMYNVSRAARRLKKEELSKKHLDEATIFLEESTDIDVTVRKHYNYFLLGGKLDHNIFFEYDADKLLNTLYAVNNALEKEEILMTKVQIWNKVNTDIMCYYLAEKFEKGYELSYKNCAEDNLDLVALLCHILFQYQLFDAEFLSYSYRNTIRNIETKKEYSEEEIAELKTIMSLLKKAKLKKDKKLKNDIEASILKIRNEGFLYIHERVAEVFVRNF